MAVQLSPNGKWIYGDTPKGGTSAFLANTVVSIREEPEGTWVSTSQGVSVLFAGAQGVAIYNLVKDIPMVLV